MKTKLKAGPIIISIIISIFGIGSLFFTILILRALLLDFDFIGLLVFTLIFMFALLTVNYSATSLKQIVVRPDQRTIEIIYWGIYKVKFSKMEIIGFRSYPLYNRIGSFQGILLEFKNGKQIQISEYDIKNLKDIQAAISTFVEYKKDLKLSLWTKINMFLLALGIFSIGIMIIGKLLGL
jgi:hypothetical protein